MELGSRGATRIINQEHPMFTEVCELLELDPEAVDYLIIDAFEDVDYELYEDFDDSLEEEAWKPESRMVEVYYKDGAIDELEIDLDSEVDEVLKRLLG